MTWLRFINPKSIPGLPEESIDTIDNMRRHWQVANKDRNNWIETRTMKAKNAKEWNAD